MYTNITDTHAHYDSSAFSDDMDNMLTSLPEAGIFRIINCGVDVESSVYGMQLSEKYGHVFFAAGIHAQDCADKEPEDIKKLIPLLTHKKCCAVGEIGLEYHYDCAPREKQKLFFEEQLRLANEYDLPVIVHDREAHGDTMEILRKYRPKGVLHCFSGSVEMAKEVLELGMYIGLGGAVTFKNAKKPVEVAKFVPEDRLLFETDCPYMTPVPFRGTRNDSTYIRYTAEFIAGLRNTNAQELINKTTKNAAELFGLY